MSLRITNLQKFKKHFTLFDVVAAICILCIVLYVLIFFSKKDSWISIEVKVSAYPTNSAGQLDGAPNFWLSKNIKPGDSQFNSLGRKIATIEKVKRWGDLVNETWITVKINAHKDKTNTIRFNYQDVAIGSPIKFQFSEYSLQGIVTHIDKVKDERIKEEKVVKARLIDWTNKSTETMGIFPWVASVVHKGDIMTTLNGDVVAEITSVEIQDADRTIVTADGQMFVGKDPSRKDVYITIKISTTKVEQTNFFLEDYPVKVDADIPLYFPTYKIIPRIIEIL